MILEGTDAVIAALGKLTKRHANPKRKCPGEPGRCAVAIDVMNDVTIPSD